MTPVTLGRFLAGFATLGGSMHGERRSQLGLCLRHNVRPAKPPAGVALFPRIKKLELTHVLSLIALALRLAGLVLMCIPRRGAWFRSVRNRAA